MTMIKMEHMMSETRDLLGSYITYSSLSQKLFGKYKII